MIVVADSGSTKCDWLFIDAANRQESTHTMGFNPLFHTTELIQNELSQNTVIKTTAQTVRHVFFYGAGCSSADRIATVSTALQQVFPHANVRVDHDLKGAALATCGNSEGITCILGTGSNACYFDGQTLHRKQPALGYILGDEASGSFFGKKIISDWLYGRMPAPLANAFAEEYTVSKETVLHAVYKEKNANVYLAGFMPFAAKHIQHPYFKEMIYEGMAEFIALHVGCYDRFRHVPIHFIGSIAYYFREVLEEVAINHRFTVGKIEKRPVEPLANYHYHQIYGTNES